MIAFGIVVNNASYVHSSVPGAVRQVAGKWMTDTEALVDLDPSRVWIARWFLLQEHERPLGDFRPKVAIVCPMRLRDVVWWDPRPKRRVQRGPASKGWGRVEDEDDDDDNGEDDGGDQEADVPHGDDGDDNAEASDCDDAIGDAAFRMDAEFGGPYRSSMWSEFCSCMQHANECSNNGPSGVPETKWRGPNESQRCLPLRALTTLSTGQPLSLFVAEMALYRYRLWGVCGRQQTVRCPGYLVAGPEGAQRCLPLRAPTGLSARQPFPFSLPNWVCTDTGCAGSVVGIRPSGVPETHGGGARTRHNDVSRFGLGRIVGKSASAPVFASAGLYRYMLCGVCGRQQTVRCPGDSCGGARTRHNDVSRFGLRWDGPYKKKLKQMQSATHKQSKNKNDKDVKAHANTCTQQKTNKYNATTSES
jgi:hypothetical protein